MIKLIAFDLDDTLLQPDESILAQDIAAIAAAQKKGIGIVPASGRRYGTMIPSARLIGHEGPLIASNGANTAAYPGEEPLYRRFVPNSIAVEIARAAESLHAYVQAYVGEDFQYDVDCEYSDLYKTMSGGGGTAVGSVSRWLTQNGQDSQKLLLIQTDPKKMLTLRREMDELFGSQLLVFHSKPMYLELTHPQASKGQALAYLAQSMGIDPSEVMAIGDGENDLSMITYAGVGVAMGNSGQSVKDQADFVTATNIQGGVGAAIRRFALLEEC